MLQKFDAHNKKKILITFTDYLYMYLRFFKNFYENIFISFYEYCTRIVFKNTLENNLFDTIYYYYII